MRWDINFQIDDTVVWEALSIPSTEHSQCVQSSIKCALQAFSNETVHKLTPGNSQSFRCHVVGYNGSAVLCQVYVCRCWIELACYTQLSLNYLSFCISKQSWFCGNICIIELIKSYSPSYYNNYSLQVLPIYITWDIFLTPAASLPWSHR